MLRIDKSRILFVKTSSSHLRAARFIVIPRFRKDTLQTKQHKREKMNIFFQVIQVWARELIRKAAFGNSRRIIVPSSGHPRISLGGAETENEA